MDSVAAVFLILSSVAISVGITWLTLDAVLRIARNHSSRMNPPSVQVADPLSSRESP